MRVMLWLAIALLAGKGMAAPVCPASIDSQETLPQVPAPWSLSPERMPQRLRAIRLFDGPPHEGATLRPEESAGGRRLVWRFDAPDSSGIWLGCVYEGSRLMLSQRIEPTPRVCEAIIAGPNPVTDFATQLRLSCR
ncbi:hypothetical protein OPU71_08940 [Niveibacterium sp. 24ML]|uniref:STY0301 family protein n=1 Tax=Niveibacterium sp. 24ML TaxID=2985512 RepID=UPI002270965F|nr:STY0301 family protein [Niveibacterium sp. 24ML]MCX9156245.1 hypothetical protein [Niveibacterium sp. 24ML]